MHQRRFSANINIIIYGIWIFNLVKMPSIFERNLQNLYEPALFILLFPLDDGSDLLRTRGGMEASLSVSSGGRLGRYGVLPNSLCRSAENNTMHVLRVNVPNFQNMENFKKKILLKLLRTPHRGLISFTYIVRFPLVDQCRLLVA